MNKVPKISELRKICRPDKHDKYFIEFYNPIISIYFTKLFVMFNISANAVTFIMIILAVIGSALLVPINYILSIIGASILVFAYLLDWTDGEVARFYRWQMYGVLKDGFTEKEEIKKSNFSDFASLKGQYLDNMFHIIFSSSVLFAFGINAYLKTSSIYLIIFGFTASYFFLLKQSISDKMNSNITDYIHYNQIDKLTLSNALKQRNIGDNSKSTVKHYVPLLIALCDIQVYYVIFFSVVYIILFWKTFYDACHKNLQKKFDDFF